MTTENQIQEGTVLGSIEDNRIQEHKSPASLKGPLVSGKDGLEGFFTPLQSLPFFELHKEKCIQCHNCVNICKEVQHRDVYTVDEQGYPALVSGTKNFRDTACNNCGQCVSACPTGALKNLLDHGQQLSSERKKVTTICSYCGVGCAIDLDVENNKVVAVNGAFTSDANEGNLCVKGRFGHEFINSPDRLKTPLIRKGGKGSPLEPVSWEEAIKFAATGLNKIKKKYGPTALGGFLSSRATNEDDFVLHRFIRTVLGTNNVDHCARLCHMASAVGLAMSVGSGAPSASTPDVRLSDAFIVIGSNTTETHPVISSAILKAKYEDNAKVVVIDPRRIELVDHADVWLRPKLGTNVAVLNGIANVILEEGLANQAFMEARSENFESFASVVKTYTPEFVEEVSQVPAERIREAAYAYAKAQRGMLMWGMGITQHLTGVDAVLALSNLMLLTGHVGRPGAGFMPIRGQNNVQGCCDMQGHYNSLPGYQGINDPAARAKFEKFWGAPLPKNKGLSVVEMEEEAVKGNMKALYIMGENPMGSSPDGAEVEKGLKNLEFLVVHDMFLNETAKLADVVFPACSFAEKHGTFTNTERRVQLLQPAIAPVGDSKPDWKIICEVAEAMGMPFSYKSSAEVMEEIAATVPSYAGIRHERLKNGGLQWPCLDIDHPGTRYLYKDGFPTQSGKGIFFGVEYDAAGENSSDRFPLLLTTGRLLEHYHTGTMSRRNIGLNAMKPEGEVEVNPIDGKRFNVKDGEKVRLVSHHGTIEVKVKITERSPEGTVFYPFHFKEASANQLTGTALDEKSKTPAYKRSAARIEKLTS